MEIKLGKSKSLEIKFIPGLIKNGIQSQSYVSNKYIDSEYYYELSFFGLLFSYVNSDYDKIIHVILKSHQTYNDNPEVKKIQVALNSIIENTWTSTNRQCPPFSVAIEYDGKNEETNVDKYTYYITVKRDWLLEHGLECLYNKFFRALQRDEIVANEEKFPSYNPYKIQVKWL